MARQAVGGFQALFGSPAAQLHPVLVNGSAGMLVTIAGQPFSVMNFTIADGKIASIDAISDPERARRLTAAALPTG